MNHFVTFEGIDGSGKSTVSKLVYKKLKSMGYEVVLTFEPTNSDIGKFVQKCIKTQNDPFVTSFAFILDRIQHSLEIKKWIEKGKIVLCDRYSDSTYAYQAVQLEKFVKNPIKLLKDLSENKIQKPDLIFLFVIDPKKSLKRIEDRDELIPFEKISFLEKVHDNYLKLSKDKNYEKLDATKDIDFLVEKCVSKILGGKIEK